MFFYYDKKLVNLIPKRSLVLCCTSLQFVELLIHSFIYHHFSLWSCSWHCQQVTIKQKQKTKMQIWPSLADVLMLWCEILQSAPVIVHETLSCIIWNMRTRMCQENSDDSEGVMRFHGLAHFSCWSSLKMSAFEFIWVILLLTIFPQDVMTSGLWPVKLLSLTINPFAVKKEGLPQDHFSFVLAQNQVQEFLAPCEDKTFFRSESRPLADWRQRQQGSLKRLSALHFKAIHQDSLWIWWWTDKNSITRRREHICTICLSTVVKFMYWWCTWFWLFSG